MVSQPEPRSNPRNHLTPEQRTLASRIAAHESWARTSDRSARTAPARDASWARFVKQADPEGVLPPDEQYRRAKHLQSAFFSRLALRSSVNRSQAKRARERAAALEAEAVEADAQLQAAAGELGDDAA